MTRRKLIQNVIKAVLGIAVGAWFLGKKVVLCKVVYAAKSKKFPGRLKPLQNIERRSKWGG